METNKFTITDLQILFLQDKINYDDVFYSSYDSRVKIKLSTNDKCERVLVIESPDGLYCTKEKILKLKDYSEDGREWIRKIN